jgi:hypothetical protein
MHYLHHVPGRLRVCLPPIKRNATAARATCAAIVRTPGVTAVESNILTGSVIIRYDPAAVSFDALVDALAATNHVDRTRLALPPGSAATTADAWQTVADGVAHGGWVVFRAASSVLVEKLVERSATALIGALL